MVRSAPTPPGKTCLVDIFRRRHSLAGVMAEGNYTVIARRWRPQQFDEIVGQEHIVRTLKNAIETGRIGHAYLFVGPRGTGKTTTARIFAKALNCTGGPNVNPPADDPLCQAIVAGACMDVIEIDAASNRSIEDAKTIRDECQYAPTQCKFKIFIIDEVHQLTKDAFNTLLKTLEEPPPHVRFIFATTEADKVMATITSRCQRFEFQPIPEDKIAGRLAQIVEADGVDASQDALIAIARLANGGMRDSQSILDQVISFCGKKIAAKDVLDIYGLASAEDIDALAGALAGGDFAKVIALADELVCAGRDLLRTLQHVQARVREALLASIREGGATDNLGASLTTEQLLRMLETLHAGEAGVRGGLSERANFEVTLLKAVEQSRTRAIDTLIKEISNIAAGLPQEAGQKKISPAQPPPAPVEKLPAAPKEPAPRIQKTDTLVKPATPAVKATPSPVAEKSAFDDGPPIDEAALAAEFGETHAVAGDESHIPAQSPQQPEKPAAFPGSVEFDAALEHVPPALRQLFHEKLRAQFVELLDLPETVYLKENDVKNASSGVALDEEVSAD